MSTGTRTTSATWFAVAATGALGLLAGCSTVLGWDDFTAGDGGAAKDGTVASSSRASVSLGSSASSGGSVSLGSSASSGASVGVSSSSGWRGSSGAWSRSSSRVGSSSSSASGECYQVATVTYPEDGGAMYCPFSAVADGGASRYCTHGGHCCETPESAGTPSTCEDGGVTCPVVNSTDWQCEGTPDCDTGQVCFGTGTVTNRAAQPHCAIDGGTLPPSIQVAGFTGSTCQASCAVIDGGQPWQICSKTSECGGGQTCVPINAKGNGVGACCSGSSTNWDCAFAARATVKCYTVIGTDGSVTCTSVSSNTPGYACQGGYIPGSCSSTYLCGCCVTTATTPSGCTSISADCYYDPYTSSQLESACTNSDGIWQSTPP